MIIAIWIVLFLIFLAIGLLCILFYFQQKKITKLIGTDLIFLLKCAETARDNDDALSKNDEIFLKKIVSLEKQFKQANGYKSKHRQTSED